jgi:hypothetical protein
LREIFRQMVPAMMPSNPNLGRLIRSGIIKPTSK